MRIRANIWHLIGRLNQPAADGFLPLRAFKPSSSESADRGRSIIQVMFKPSSSDSADRGRSIIQVKVKAKGLWYQTEDFKGMFHIHKQSTQSHVHFTHKYHEILLYHSFWVVFAMVFQELWSAEFTSPFTWKVISKKYFSWTAMRTHSPIHLFESAINFNSFSNIFFSLLLEFRLQFIFLFTQLLFRITAIRIVLWVFVLLSIFLYSD